MTPEEKRARKRERNRRYYAANPKKFIEACARRRARRAAKLREYDGSENFVLLCKLTNQLAKLKHEKNEH